ncbi:hypothetical protein [Treponema pectinovorum]|uniref:hypothetical protein n=1 Tax=Treponema pectinovorum TaxID=164 RepID=UPI0011F1990D|nr:hypothetical protein [Treponema pectinovorum]
MKTKIAYRFAFFSAFIFVFSFFFYSCTFFKDSFNEPVKDFFKEYTETSGILGYKISSSDFVRGNDGSLIIPSYKDVEVDFYLRNPQRYVFTSGSNMSLAMNSLDCDKFFALWGSYPNTNLVKISQDNSDVSILRLVYPSDFLIGVDNGFDITPTVRMFHPHTGADFGTFSPIKIICNTPPPPVYGAVIYKDTNKYYVLFNMPEKSILKSIHRDIEVVTINNAISSDISINNSDGTFVFSNASFKLGNPISSLSLEKCSQEFIEHGQPAYFETGDLVSSENKSYTITIKDSAGLSSVVTTSVQSVKLGQVTVTDKNGAEVLTNSELNQDEDSSYATLTIIPSATGSDGSTIRDTVVIYELYEGTDSSGKLILSGSGTSGSVNIEVPCGDVFLRVYSHKDYYADSLPVEMKIKVLRTNVYVSSSGNDTTNNGSKASPYKTVKNAINNFNSPSANNKITLLTDIIEESPVTLGSTFNVQIEGNIKNLNIPGVGLNLSGKLTLNNAVINCQKISLNNASASLTLAGSSKVQNENASEIGIINFAGAGCFVTVDENLSANSSVAKIAWNSSLDSSYTRGTAVLKAVNGKNLTQNICNKFELSSNQYVIKLEDGIGVLAQSGGSLNVVPLADGIIFELSSEAVSVFKLGKSITVSAKKDGVDITSNCTWAINVYNNGTYITPQNITDAGGLLSDNSLTLPNAFPTGTYSIIATAIYNGKTYSATFNINVEAM